MAAVVGFRIDPGATRVGLTYQVESEFGSLLVSFHTAIRETVRQSLSQGLSGWPVTDIVVSLVETAYDSVCSTAGDFRRATPLALFAALRRAGTDVYEPLHAFDLEIPPDTCGPGAGRPQPARGAGHRVGPRRHGLAGARRDPAAPDPHAAARTARTHPGRGRLGGSSGGDRRLQAAEAPTAPRHDGNPLDEETYLRYLRGW